MDYTTETALDIRDNSNYCHVICEQDHYGYDLRIAINNGGNPFYINGSTATFELGLETPYSSAVTISDNKVVVPITEAIVKQCGLYPFQIRLNHGDSFQITTVTNYISVRKEGE